MAIFTEISQVLKNTFRKCANVCGVVQMCEVGLLPLGFFYPIIARHNFIPLLAKQYLTKSPLHYPLRLTISNQMSEMTP